jgi:hypothetical protein
MARGLLLVSFEVLPNGASLSNVNGARSETAQIDTGCDYALIIPEERLGDFPVYNRSADGAVVIDVRGNFDLHDSYDLDVEWIGGRKRVMVVAVPGAQLLAGRPLFADDSELVADWRNKLASVS